MQILFIINNNNFDKFLCLYDINPLIENRFLKFNFYIIQKKDYINNFYHFHIFLQLLHYYFHLF